MARRRRHYTIPYLHHMHAAGSSTLLLLLPGRHAIHLTPLVCCIID
jgi:hypothetical protein